MKMIEKEKFEKKNENVWRMEEKKSDQWFGSLFEFEMFLFLSFFSNELKLHQIDGKITFYEIQN